MNNYCTPKSVFSPLGNSFKNTVKGILVGVLYFVCSTTNAQSPGGVSSTLTLWLDAQDIDADGLAEGASETGIISGEVATWSDKSGQSNDVTGTDRPSLSLNTLNYNPVLDFDSDYLTTSSAGQITPNTAYTKFVVFSFDSGGHNNLISSAPGGSNTAFWTESGTAETISLWHQGTFLTSTPVLVLNNYYVASARFGAGGLMNIININGEETVSSTSNPPHADASPVQIGGYNGISLLDGKIAEAIIYDRALSDVEIDQVESYLALKYGHTLTPPQSYVANGSTIWDATANPSYNNDIFGIGQDNASALDQKVSKSINTDAIITLANDNDFTSANSDAGRTSLGEGNFAVIGNNGGTPAWTTTGAPSGVSRILSRQWRIDETGTVGSLNIQFDVADTDFNVPVPLAGEVYHIVVDTDNDQDLSDETSVALINTSGDLWSRAVDFADGAVFTLASGMPPSPGGVTTDLLLWLKADAGVTAESGGDRNVSNWADQSGNANHAAQTIAANQPKLIATTDAFNKNATIDFNGLTDFLNLTTGLDLDGTQDSHIYAVFNNLGTNKWLPILANSGNGQTGYMPTVQKNSSDVSVFVNYRGSRASGPNLLSLTETHLIGFEVSGGGTATRVYDKSEVGMVGSGIGIVAEPTSRVGGSYGERTTMDIAEIIVYNDDSTPLERQQIESYLAIKYGITLHTSIASYKNAAGGDIWADATYWNDIFGIGQENASALDQRVSKSVNTDAIITLANDNDFTSANSDAGRTSLGEGNLAVIGNNGGAATWTTTGAPTGYNILSRQWKIDETGTVGTLNIQFDVADTDFDVPNLLVGPSYYIIVDTNDDQDLSDETPIALSNTPGDLWFTAVDFADGAVFSLASEGELVPPMRHGKRFLNEVLQPYIKEN